MRNLFLVFFCIVFAFTMKTVKKKEQMEVLYIEKSQVIDFNGTLFVPRTIRLLQSSVKPKVLEVSVAGKKYIYYPSYELYYLKGEVKEVGVRKGDTLKVTETGTTLRFFFAREV